MNSAAITVTAAALETFVAAVSEMVVAAYRKGAPSIVEPPTLAIEAGRRYARIVKTWHGSRCAYMFVDLTNGDILKPHGWKGPAKHARGNIFAANPLQQVRAHGVG